MGVTETVMEALGLLALLAPYRNAENEDIGLVPTGRGLVLFSLAAGSIQYDALTCTHVY